MFMSFALQRDQSRALFHVGGDADRERAKQFGIAEYFPSQFMRRDQPMATIVGGVNDVSRVFNQRVQK